MKCDVYMGAEDVERQRLNVFRMEMMGATVHAVEIGTKTLKDAVDAAFAAWMTDLAAFYVLGSAVDPHPYLTIVHEFQKVISQESRREILDKEGAYQIILLPVSAEVLMQLEHFLNTWQIKKSI